jgi:membrane-associated phospholipid phosphatase
VLPATCHSLLPLASSGLDEFERRIVQALSCDMDVEWLGNVFQAVQSKTLAVPLFLFVALVLALRTPRRALRATLTAGLGFAIGMGIAALLWMAVDRQRPPHHFETHLRTPAEIATCASQPEALVLHKSPSRRPSFPSRHGITIGCFVTALFLANRWLGVLAILYGAVAAVGRVYVARHFPTDVLAGIVIGSGVGWAVWRLLPPVVALWGHRHLIEAPAAETTTTDADGVAR